MRRGFTLIELVLTLAVVAMIMAAIAPAVVGSLRAFATWRAVVDTVAVDQRCCAILRDDLAACPRAVGSTSEPFQLDDGELRFTTYAQGELHPQIAVRPARGAERRVVWRIVSDEQETRLLRSSDPHVLASGIRSAVPEELMLAGLARASFTVCTGTSSSDRYDSDGNDGNLPTAIEFRYAHLRPDGSAGPERVRYIALPQVRLDPLQQDGG